MIDAQQEAIDKLSKLKVGALFMEMGTGKTKVALDLIASKRHKVDYVLWICPFSLKGEIEVEKEKWHPDLDIEIVGCESIGSSDRIYLDLLNKVNGKRLFMVVDESLKIKNIRAKRTKRILSLGELATYKLILNGTPISKNILDLWTQMDFLSPKILNMSYLEFKNNYCVYYIRGKLKGMVKNQTNIPHLISLISPYIYESKLSLNVSQRHSTMCYDIDSYEQYQAYISPEYSLLLPEDHAQLPLLCPYHRISAAVPERNLARFAHSTDTLLPFQYMSATDGCCCKALKLSASLEHELLIFPRPGHRIIRPFGL